MTISISGGLSILSEHGGRYNTRCTPLDTKCFDPGDSQLCQESGAVALREHAGRAGAVGPDQDQRCFGLLPDAASIYIPESLGTGSTSCAAERCTDIPNAQRSESSRLSQCPGELENDRISLTQFLNYIWIKICFK